MNYGCSTIFIKDFYMYNYKWFLYVQQMLFIASNWFLYAQQMIFIFSKWLIHLTRNLHIQQLEICVQ